LNRINLLFIIFSVQVLFFFTFVVAFFTMEQRRQAEIHDLQLELHHLRNENLKVNKQLIAADVRRERTRFDLSDDELTDNYAGYEGEDGEGEEEGDVKSSTASEDVKANAINVTRVGYADAWPQRKHKHRLNSLFLNTSQRSPFADAIPCARKKLEYWTYEVCLGYRVRQFHEHDHKEAVEEYLLGTYRPDVSSSPLKQQYADGDPCPTSQHARNVEVQLECAVWQTKLLLTQVYEPSECNYIIQVVGQPGLCKSGAGSLKIQSTPSTPLKTVPKQSIGRTPSASEFHGDLIGALSVGGTEDVPAKRAGVVAALAHAWRGYEKYAFGADELKPISRSKTNWVGLGLTILDSLDVLWMADLREQYSRAVEWVRKDLRFDNNPKMISFFETTIRCLGGLLAAYELAGEQVLLDRATDLGKRLAAAFSSPSGLPYSSISLTTGHHTIPSWTGGNLLLAEVGTVQLEFFSLAYHAKLPELAGKAQRVIDVLDREGGTIHKENLPSKENSPGWRLFPIYVRPETGKPSGAQVSWGAMGDSFYEYLLKMWLFTGKRNDMYKRMYLESVRGMQAKLVHTDDGLTYVAELSRAGVLTKKMDHLVCFVPGMLALGAQHLPEQHDEHMALAAKLTETCYQMYARQATGLAPEFVKFGRGLEIGAAHNLLRPETVESLFYMWRFTHDPKYREWGWKIFVAFEKHCRIEGGGYAGIKQVNNLHSAKDDTMQTFWLAETLKYLLLLFSDDAALSLTTKVINTEAHPLSVIPPDPSPATSERHHSDNAKRTQHRTV